MRLQPNSNTIMYHMLRTAVLIYYFVFSVCYCQIVLGLSDC